MYRRGILPLLCLTFILGRAQAAAACPPPQTYKDIVACALENHPDIIRAENAKQQGQLLDRVARQRPNPDLAAKAIRGSGSGESVSTIDVDLLHTFELGGKRDARIRQAESQQQLLSTDAEVTKAEVFVKTVGGLYRLRQLNEEESILDETLETFSRIQKLFRNRPRLSPEQETSLSVFQLAKEDAELKKAALKSQISELYRMLSLAAGKEISFSPAALPPIRDAWPEVLSSPKEDSFKLSPSMKNAAAALSAAQADLENAKSQAWPDMKVGPSWERETTGSSVSNAFGLSLVFTLPIFHTNGAGLGYAAAGLEKAQREAQLRSASLTAEREVLLARYSDSVAALKRAFDVHALDKKHKNLEGLFDRGLIPSQLVIESHRQLLDFVKSRNEHELTAIEALYRIRAIDGTNLLEAL